MTSNYYQLLEISPNANLDVIKAAYRKLAKKFHPDLNPNNSYAAEYFKRINEAYKVLSDPIKRHNYDVLYIIRAPKTSFSTPQQTFFGSSIKTAPSTSFDPFKAKNYTTVRVAFTKSERASKSHFKHPKIHWRELPRSHYLILSSLTVLILFLGSSEQLTFNASCIFLLVHVFVSSAWISRMIVNIGSRNNVATFSEILLIHLFALIISAILSVPLLFFIWFLVDLIPVSTIKMGKLWS